MKPKTTRLVHRSTNMRHLTLLDNHKTFLHPRDCRDILYEVPPATNLEGLLLSPRWSFLKN